MRILWLGHNLAYPPKGGVLQRNYNLLRQIARNHEVHVLVFDQPATRPPGVTPEDCVRALREFCAGVEWVPLSGRGLKGNRYWLALKALADGEPFGSQWLQSNDMTERLKTAVENIRFDIVHFDTIGLAQYRILVGQSASILNHHNVESLMMERRARNDTNIIRRKYWFGEAARLLQAEQKWCPRFAMNLVVSDDDARWLEELISGITTAVVANGVDTDYFTPRPDPGGSTLLFCGGMTWYPNHDAMRFFFAEVWPVLIQRRPEVEIDVVGKHPPAWLCRRGRSDGRIRVHGFVDDVRPYFRKATAYVCPIRLGGGTRLKVLDALAMGVPVVGTPFACSGLSLKNGGHVLLAETPEEFVHQIERLLDSSQLRTELATNGSEVVTGMYSWDIIGNDLERAYERALQHNQNWLRAIA